MRNLPASPPRAAAAALPLLLLLVLGLAVSAEPAAAKIELVTLPDRAACQLTIYNSADLTLVRDERTLTFRKGANRIEFSWENTRIDPTSLQIEPMPGAPPFRVIDAVFPPRVANTLVWNIEADQAGECPVRISYFTAGIGWSADYALVLDAEEKAALLSGAVTVNNGSGEDYENSAVRLVVGKVHLVESMDQIATGRGAVLKKDRRKGERRDVEMFKAKNMLLSMDEGSAGGAAASAPKEILKEALADYFVFSVEGRETVENGWAKRLPSVKVPGLVVESVFKHEDFRLGPEPVRFVTFVNDKAHNMGKEPLPDGRLRVLKVDAKGNLQYLGATNQKYIPIDGTVEVNLGADREVKVEVTPLDWRTEEFGFNHRGDPDGWDEISVVKVRIRNFKSNPVRVEMKRRFGGKWALETEAAFEREDVRTVKFTRTVPPAADDVFTYTLRTFKGRNAEGR